MTDRKFSATHVYSLAFWVAGFAFVVVEVVTSLDVGELGILLAGIGGVANIKGFLLNLECREREAFHMGEEVERLRSVN